MSPNRVQGARALASSAAFWRRSPKPNRRKSTSAMVPNVMANPRIWKHSRIGKASADSLRGFSKAINMEPIKTLAQKASFLDAAVDLCAELAVVHKLKERVLLGRSEE